MQDLSLTDVTLRDGLQMETQLFDINKKLALFHLLAAVGYSRLEITSFVSPKWVPQFSDADEFCAKLYEKPIGIECMAFAPNEKGMDRLLRFPIPWVGSFVAVTESFNKKNVNASISQTIETLRGLTIRAHSAGRKIRIYVSAAFGCPFEGKVTTKQLEALLGNVVAISPDEIAISDTIGVATPSQVREVLGMSKQLFPVEKTALHLHQTYGMALANVVTAYGMGIRRFDGTTGGIGGCPFAEGASGNMPLEEILYWAYREGALSVFPHRAIKSVWEWLGQQTLAIHSHLFDVLGRRAEPFGVEENRGGT